MAVAVCCQIAVPLVLVALLGLMQVHTKARIESDGEVDGSD